MKDITLLLVDDEPGVLKSLKRIFLLEGYHILTANNADEALALIDKEKVHLVISDLRMPGMNGTQLLSEIKKRWPTTVRIMLTGFPDIQALTEAINTGAVQKFITKPWHDEDLKLTVQLALQPLALIEENKRLKELTEGQQRKLDRYFTVLDKGRGVLGNILVRAGCLAKERLEQAARNRQANETLAEALVRQGLITEEGIVRTLQDFLKLDAIDLKKTNLDPLVVRFLPMAFCHQNRLIPVRADEKTLTIAMADPSDIFKCDAIEDITGLMVLPIIATATDILKQLTSCYGELPKEAQTPEPEPGPQEEPEGTDDIDVVVDQNEERINLQELIGSSEIAPVVKIVNGVISGAIRLKASDIHIEPKSHATLVRFRIDGLLQQKFTIPTRLHPAVISRIKILSQMDISERRIPQDGRITVRSGKKTVDVRVSTMPTIHGEKVVIRVLDQTTSVKRLDELGLLPEDLVRLNVLIKKPQGIILTTGPTGSGKTTMLYAILQAMLEGTKNYHTIEDPVEYLLEPANQIYVREKIGLSFASVLRATLRQDPDVIMVGEIRDAETADIAFKAALTGHMVLSTLHTNSSVASVTRLIDMGVRPYLIASAIEGLLAQRLVRTICPGCREPIKPDANLLQLLKIPKTPAEFPAFKGKGCEECQGTSYRGRTGVFELFAMNDEFRQHITGNYKESELLKMSRAGGMETLIEDGIRKVHAGITTLEELLRVMGTQTRFERPCELCEKMIEVKFLFCPYCGGIKRNFCSQCMLPLEKTWLHCPSCGKRNEDP